MSENAVFLCAVRIIRVPTLRTSGVPSFYSAGLLAIEKLKSKSGTDRLDPPRMKAYINPKRFCSLLAKSIFNVVNCILDSIH
jgi:hypothetical protein